MAEPLLLVDASFMAHRAFHTPGMDRLSYRGKPTGTVYGFLRDTRTLMESFNTDQLVFFFEFGIGIREIKFPGYKANRGIRDPLFNQQLLDLMNVHLPGIGFNNIQCQDGYEADDLIAEYSHGGNWAPDEDIVIVSADKDLYQCLRRGVRQYNPIAKKTMTVKRFKEHYGIHPDQWADVKSIAGCKTDNVIGVPGEIGRAHV